MNAIWSTLPLELSINICMFLPDGIVRQVSKKHREAHAHSLKELTIRPAAVNAENAENDPNPEYIYSLLRTTTSLTKLILSNSPVTHIAPLAEMKNLTHLTLSHTRIQDVSPLRDLKRLLVLYLDNTDVSDISPLAQLKSMRIINMSWTNVADVSPLSELKSLQGLSLSNTRVTCIPMLREFSSLILLNISRLNLTDKAWLNQLRELKSLEILFMYRSNITDGDLSPLAELKSLKELHISLNCIQDIAPLSNLTGLTTLDMSNCWTAKNSADISILANLTNLVELNMSPHVP